MADTAKDEDPSIEEILDSIRQIITDDDEDAPQNDGVDDTAHENDAPEFAPEDTNVSESDTADTEADDDIVELTDKVEPNHVNEQDDETGIQIDMTDSNENIDAIDDTFEQIDKETSQSDETDNNADDDIEAILSDRAERATVDAFSDLARTALVERAGQVTLEDVVRQEVRPLLKSWLSDHLPGIVERLLEKELQRISNRFLDD